MLLVLNFSKNSTKFKKNITYSTRIEILCYLESLTDVLYLYCYFVIKALSLFSIRRKYLPESNLLLYLLLITFHSSPIDFCHVKS